MVEFDDERAGGVLGRCFDGMKREVMMGDGGGVGDWEFGKIVNGSVGVCVVEF